MTCRLLFILLKHLRLMLQHGMNKEKAVHEICSRIRHVAGKWIWIRQRVIVLSVTPDRHIDKALLLVDSMVSFLHKNQKIIFLLIIK